MISSKILDSEIKYWKELLPKSNIELIELAFFKIFVRFENFISDAFLHYSLGKRGKNRYSPSRILKFQSENQLRAVFKGKNTNYNEFLNDAKEKSKYIFEENKNPFELIFDDAQFITNFNLMKHLRNYIAHNSIESKAQYIKNNLNDKNYIEPHKYLTKIKQGRSNYTKFIEEIGRASKILIDPKTFF